tara:strand:- start:227 stop:781 length:555 start_codon:yes stop_codon:yes gene_type:complete
MDNTQILLLGAGAYLITKVAQYNVDSIRYDYKCEKPLYDFFHQVIPNLKRYELFIDLVPILLGVAVFYLYMYDNLDEQLIRDAIINYAILMVVRAVFFSVTILPSPICSKRFKTKAIGGCHDCIFSAHATLMLLLAYALYKHNPQYQTALIIYCILGSLLIIGTRSHYSIDVITAYAVVYSLLK